MVGKLLLRGMLVGILAGLLSFVFLKVVGEPEVDRAIAFEARMDHGPSEHAAGTHVHGATMAAEPAADEELVSRATQAGVGLFTGVLVYSVAFGGLFALVFAMAYGRFGALGARATSAVLGVVGFIAVYVVPNLKYPANPPAVGDHDTIGMRTGLYFSMIVISLVAAVAATKLRGSLDDRFGEWNATIAAGAFFLVAVTVAGVLLPGFNEVPDTFDAVLLWRFRLASLGAQLIMWTTIALVFGAFAERLLAPRDGARRYPGPLAA